MIIYFLQRKSAFLDIYIFIMKKIIIKFLTHQRGSSSCVHLDRSINHSPFGFFFVVDFAVLNKRDKREIGRTSIARRRRRTLRRSFEQSLVFPAMIDPFDRSAASTATILLIDCVRCYGRPAIAGLGRRTSRFWRVATLAHCRLGLNARSRRRYFVPRLVLILEQSL